MEQIQQEDQDTPQQPDSKPLVVFHKSCCDGFAAAFAAGIFLGFDEVEFLAADYHDAPPDVTDRVVYVVDFSYKRAELEVMANAAEYITIIDHHVGAIKDLAGFEHPNVSLHMREGISGGKLTWEVLNQVSGAARSDPPTLFTFLEDHDLWTKKYAESTPIATAVYASGVIESLNWELFRDWCSAEMAITDLSYLGMAILRANKNTIKKIIGHNLRVYKFMGHMVPIINMPYEFASVAGEVLYEEGYPFVMMYEEWMPNAEYPHGLRKWSVRSKQGVGPSIQNLCRYLGGNGHDHAAGFVTSSTENIGYFVRLHEGKTLDTIPQEN